MTDPEDTKSIIESRASAAIEELRGYLGELEERLPPGSQSWQHNDWLGRWARRVAQAIECHLGIDERHLFERNLPRFDSLQFKISGDNRAILELRQGLANILEELSSHPSTLLKAATMTSIGTQDDQPAARRPKTVFLIHGHDDAALNELDLLLRKQWQLEPVILRDVPSSSQTIIEKFEEVAGQSSFAIALLTPDDLVPTRLEGNPEEHRPRPNVVFELGWFCGRLGRSNVCIMRKRPAEIHSDLAGVERLEFGSIVEECALQLQSALRKAGLID